MSFYYGWMPDDKKAWHDAAQANKLELDHITKYLASRNMPEEIASLRQEFIGLIGPLQAIYGGIEKKEDKTIKKEYDRWNLTFGKYLKNANNIAGKYLLTGRLPDHFSIMDTEVAAIDDEKEKIFINKPLT